MDHKVMTFYNIFSLYNKIKTFEIEIKGYSIHSYICLDKNQQKFNTIVCY